MGAGSAAQAYCRLRVRHRTDPIFETDGHVLREQIQRLLPCILDERPVPKGYCARFGKPGGTPWRIRAPTGKTLLEVTCALVRKDRHDDKKEEWKLALDTSSTNRSYLFGRLLAVAEQVERTTYDREEKRDPNAFACRRYSPSVPYAWRIIEEKLNPYYARLNQGCALTSKTSWAKFWTSCPNRTIPLPQRLEDVYLLGYYQQRTALTRKKKTL
ncbi:MAG: type I-C CRISPR-associated protein Cas8c/Csd1 [Hydrogeniiclostridium mannosilyticum]